MATALSPALTDWLNFYVIVGSSAGALTGLQFVVIALISETQSTASMLEVRAFGTPTVVHFCAALFVSGNSDRAVALNVACRSQPGCSRHCRNHLCAHGGAPCPQANRVHPRCGGLDVVRRTSFNGLRGNIDRSDPADEIHRALYVCGRWNYAGIAFRGNS
jgi:hypothetical protein